MSVRFASLDLARSVGIIFVFLHLLHTLLVGREEHFHTACPQQVAVGKDILLEPCVAREPVGHEVLRRQVGRQSRQAGLACSTGSGTFIDQ